MTGYGGYFMQGMASGLESGVKMGSQLLELKWRKQAKADAEKADQAMIDALSNLNAKFQNNGTYDSIGLGGGYDLGAGTAPQLTSSPTTPTAVTPSTNITTPNANSPFNAVNPNNFELPKTGSLGVLASQEGMAVIAASMALTDTKANIVKDIMLAIDKGDREKYTELMDYYKNLTNYIAEFNMAGLSVEDSVYGLFDILPEGELKYKKYLDTYKETPSANMPYEMTKQMGEKAGFNMPETFTEPPKPTDTQVKLAEIDKLTFLTEERRNQMKVNTLANDSATTEKVRAIRGAGGTDADILEAFGAGVQGVNPPKPETTTTAAPTSIESIRTDILNADTLEDAQRMYDNHVRKYGEEGLKVNLPKDWTDVKQGDLMDLISVLDEITAGTSNIKSKEKHSFEINGKAQEKTGEEWYKEVYESYVALLKLLEEQGVDTSQYKKLKPLSEIKAGFLKGLTTFGGVGRGDLVNIYY